VLADVPGDSVFEYDFKYPYWKKVEHLELPASETDQFPSRYVVYEKRNKTTRYRLFPEFLTGADSRREWIEKNLSKITSESVKPASKESTLSLFPEEDVTPS
jgi:hypothetical protein